MSVRLSWDAHGDASPGWRLRHRDAHGSEHVTAITAPHGATLAELVAAVEAALGQGWADGVIRVYRGGGER